MISNFGMKKEGLILLLLIIFLQTVDGYAQSTNKKVFSGLDFDLKLSTVYDDNILRYSDYYLTKFENSEDSGRFHIQTSDGIILNTSLELSATFLLIGKNKTILACDLNPQFYLNNSIKNWTHYGLNLQQFVYKGISVNLSYNYLPSYYVRHYRDDDWADIFGYTPESYQPFSFSKNEYGIWIQNSFFKKKTTRLRLMIDYDEYFYNEHYTEYDCTNTTFGFRIYNTIRKKLKLDFGYRFCMSNAKGYDEPGELKETSDDSDPSSDEDEYYCAAKWSFNPIFKRSSSFAVDFLYRKSCYTTKHYLELDKLHAGRTDYQYRLKLTYEIILLKSLRMSVFYVWNKQDSDTKAEANIELVSREKDYLQNQYGLSFRYSIEDIKFTHQK